MQAVDVPAVVVVRVICAIAQLICNVLGNLIDERLLWLGFYVAIINKVRHHCLIKKIRTYYGAQRIEHH